MNLLGKCSQHERCSLNTRAFLVLLNATKPIFGCFIHFNQIPFIIYFGGTETYGPQIPICIKWWRNWPYFWCAVFAKCRLEFDGKSTALSDFSYIRLLFTCSRNGIQNFFESKEGPHSYCSFSKSHWISILALVAFSPIDFRNGKNQINNNIVLKRVETECRALL